MDKNLKLINSYELYLENEKGFTDDSVEAYLRDIKNFSEFIKISLINVSSKHVGKYIKFLSKDGLSKRSIARHISSLKNFYVYLLKREQISVSPMEDIEMPKIPKSLPDYLSIDEMESLLDIPLNTANDYRNKAMLELMYATGLRISELINLEFVNLDLDNDVVKVMGKGRKERLVPIGDFAKEALEIYLNSYRNMLVKKGQVNNYVFISYRGTQITRQGVFKIIKAECKRAEIKKEVSPHTIRHSFATHLLNNGADLRIIQELLGHSNISTTEIYMHLATEKLKKDYEEHHPRSHK